MELKTNIHPGEILDEEFLKPLNLSAYKLSKAIEVQQTRISQIIKGSRSITADTAIRLGKFFGTTEEFWMNLQREYDLRNSRAKKSEEFERIIQYEIPERLNKVAEEEVPYETRPASKEGK